GLVFEPQLDPEPLLEAGLDSADVLRRIAGQPGSEPPIRRAGALDELLEAGAAPARRRLGRGLRLGGLAWPTRGAPAGRRAARRRGQHEHPHRQGRHGELLHDRAAYRVAAAVAAALAAASAAATAPSSEGRATPRPDRIGLYFVAAPWRLRLST